LKRPAPVTASIVVFSILAFLSAGLFSLMVASRSSAAAKNPITAVTMAITLGLPVAAWILDIVFLAVRRRWVYWYNLVLVALAILVCVGFALASLWFLPMAEGFPVGMKVALGVFYAIPAGLLAWLLAELLRRKDVREYLSRSAVTTEPTAGEPGA
jgi:hypothetical protein